MIARLIHDTNYAENNIQRTYTLAVAIKINLLRSSDENISAPNVSSFSGGKVRPR